MNLAEMLRVLLSAENIHILMVASKISQYSPTLRMQHQGVQNSTARNTQAENTKLIQILKAEFVRNVVE